MGKRRITLNLDEKLLTAVNEVAAERGKSLHQFVTDALRRALKEIERERIDAEFARMADDREYQGILLRMEGELAPLSEEAWRHVPEP